MGAVPASSEADLPCPATRSLEGWQGDSRVLEHWKQCRMGAEHRTHEAGTSESRVSTRNLPEKGQMQECN